MPSISLRSLWSLLVDVGAGVLLGTIACVTPVRTLRLAWVAMRGIELLLLIFLVFKVWWLGDGTLLAVRSPVDRPDIASHSLLDDYVIGAVRDYDFGQLDHFHRLWIAHFVLGVAVHLTTGLVLPPLLASVILFKHIVLHPIVRAHLLEQPVVRPWAGSPVPPNPSNKAGWLASLGVFESAPASIPETETTDAPVSGHAGFAAASATAPETSPAAVLALCLEEVAVELAAMGAQAAGATADIETGGSYLHGAVADAQASLGAAALALAVNTGDSLSPALVGATARLTRDLEVARAATQARAAWISLPFCGSPAARPELYLARPRALNAAVYADEKQVAAVEARPVEYDEKATQATEAV